MNFVKAATCRRAQRSGLAHRFDSSEVKGWLDATCWAKLRPLFTFVLVQRFEFYIWMWWASCNYNKWACTLMFWCNLSLPQIIFLGYIGPINRKKTHLIISRLGSAWILFVLSGVKFEFVTKKKKNTRQFQRKSLYLQTLTKFHKIQVSIYKTLSSVTWAHLFRYVKKSASINQTCFLLHSGRQTTADGQFRVSNSPCACFWSVGGSWRTRREHAQTRGEHSNSTQKGPGRPRELNQQPSFCEATALTTASVTTKSQHEIYSQK